MRRSADGPERLHRSLESNDNNPAAFLSIRLGGAGIERRRFARNEKKID
ncbi:hypothetical protein B4114_2885 [Geobacillus stearothermophilus]|uniref:Uncharacterized protein n=1 Tax=Geobacillus stearothermophilus TaxID=1422 RepID=A0A150NCP5_GEOSE|nr:hypothetical protein B4114_2885 [Geobacillus stearothermophilus]